MNLLNKYFEKYALIIFGIITLIIICFRQPFFDETHAYDIACLKFSEIFQLTRVEGHTFLWFYVLKPFCALNLFPYSMLLVNWAFCMGALYVLWKKAPFTTFQKTFITFSTPFLLYYAIVARCYSLGIFFLFLLCSFYSKRFKKPYLFSSLLCICANCNTMMAVGCFYLGLIYFFELILRYKKGLISGKKVLNATLIFIFCAVLLLAQFVKLEPLLDNGATDYFLMQFISYFIPFGVLSFSLIFKILCACTFYYLFFYMFKKSKKALLFILPACLTITYIFANFYSGHFWNYYTYLIYFIAFCWIFASKIRKDRVAKFLITSIIFMLLFPYSIFKDGKIEFIFRSKAKQMAQEILNNKELRKSKLYQLEWWSDVNPGASRYLAKHNIKIYDIHNRNRISFEALRDIFRVQRDFIEFDKFYEIMDKNAVIVTENAIETYPFKEAYLFKKNDDYFLKTKKANYKFESVVKKDEIRFRAYKVYKI